MPVVRKYSILGQEKSVSSNIPADRKTSSRVNKYRQIGGALSTRLQRNTHGLSSIGAITAKENESSSSNYCEIQR